MSSNVYFNPRSHERSDSDTTAIKQIWSNFNPRSHERSDKEHGVIEADQENFNPRSHERSDRYEVLSFPLIEISIHAPTRGATAILHKKFVYFYTIPTINI